jgi:hypothetical protein
LSFLESLQFSLTKRFLFPDRGSQAWLCKWLGFFSWCLHCECSGLLSLWPGAAKPKSLERSRIHLGMLCAYALDFLPDCVSLRYIGLLRTYLLFNKDIVSKSNQEWLPNHAMKDRTMVKVSNLFDLELFLHFHLH